jgi:hypothetical protein
VNGGATLRHLFALEAVLAETGAPIETGKAMPAAGKVLWG